MPNSREGDVVRVIDRPVTDEDRKANRYFDHMKGLTGTVASVFAEDQIAIRVEGGTLPKVSRDVHKKAVERMRKEFVEKVSEEQKKLLTSEELNFDANFMILARSADLERV